MPTARSSLAAGVINNQLYVVGGSDGSKRLGTLEVFFTNNPPVASGDSYSTNEDTILNVAAPGVLANDNDVDGNPLSAILVSNPSSGTLTLNANGGFIYTPNANFNGADNFTYKANDGSADSNVAMVAITVNPVNDPPIFDPISDQSILEDAGSQSVSITGLSPGPANEAGQTITMSATSSNPALIPNPIITGTTLTYQPLANANGAATITVVAHDNGGTANGIDTFSRTFQVTVNAVNDAPVLGAIGNKNVDEETELTFAATATDPDIPVEILSMSLGGAPAGASITPAGVFSWTPTEAQGPDTYTFDVVVSDGSLTDSETITVTVNEVNVPPVLGSIGDKSVDEETLLTFTATAADADIPPQTLTFSLSGAPAGASITPAGVFSWTPTEAQGPGTYTFDVVVSDGSLTDSETITVTVNEVNVPPVLGSIGDKSVLWDNLLTFTATATDADIPANMLTFSLADAPTVASIDPTTGIFTWTPTSAQIGSHTFKVHVADNGISSLYDEEEITVTVGKRTTMLVYNGAVSGQYSDPISISATLTDQLSGAPISGKMISFTLGAQSASETTAGSGVATSSIALNQQPVSSSVQSVFSGDDLYLASNDNDPFLTIQEDARATYTGALYASTSSVTSGTAAVTLAATIQDITAATGDPAYDPYAGDIRNAKVTFVNRDTNTPIATVDVSLVSPGDTKTGTALYNWNVDIGAAESKDFTVGIIVSNYYTRNASSDNTVVTVSKPLDNFITGGGYLVMTNSAGQYQGASGTKANFGFNVKYNKKGTNLQGHVNIIVRNNGGVYQIKSNAINSLSADAVTGTATFNSKASIQDITNPVNPIPIDGNAVLMMTMTDRGEPGSDDTIGITLWNKDGVMLFSSKWDGTRTVEQTLGGGNLVVH